MLVTRNHQIDTSQINWDIAHLYEHLLILGAKKYLESVGVNIDLFGWISGETFEERIFIDAGFYDERVAKLYDIYMSKVPQFSDSDIEKAVSSVEAEEKSRFTVAINDLRIGLDDFRGSNVEAYESKVLLKHTIVKSAEREFVDISIGISSGELSIASQKVFLRLRTILSDIIGNYSSKSFAYYERGVGPTRITFNKVEFISVLTIDKTNISKMETQIINLQQCIRNYPVDNTWVDFKQHFDEFASQQLWKIVTTEYYRCTGLATTTDEICNLATRERIIEIFSKINIKMHKANQTDISLIS